MTSCCISNSRNEDVRKNFQMLKYFVTFGSLDMNHAGYVSKLKLGEESVKDLKIFMNLLGVVRCGGQTLFSQK